MLASSTWLLRLVAMEQISIGWESHVIQVHVTWVPMEIRKSTEGLWNKLYNVPRYSLVSSDSWRPCSVVSKTDKKWTYKTCGI